MSLKRIPPPFENINEFNSKFEALWNLNSVALITKSVKPWPISVNIFGIFFIKYPEGGLRSISLNKVAKKIAEPINIR